VNNYSTNDATADDFDPFASSLSLGFLRAITQAQQAAELSLGLTYHAERAVEQLYRESEQKLSLAAPWANVIQQIHERLSIFRLGFLKLKKAVVRPYVQGRRKPRERRRAGRPVFARSSSRSGDSGDDSDGDPEPPRRFGQPNCKTTVKSHRKNNLFQIRLATGPCLMADWGVAA
jgi:hypothetical protein